MQIENKKGQLRAKEESGMIIERRFTSAEKTLLIHSTGLKWM